MILLIVILATYKFHLRFNVERKFIDLENKSKSNFVYANEIHKNLNNLKQSIDFSDYETHGSECLKNLRKRRKDQMI